MAAISSEKSTTAMSGTTTMASGGTGPAATSVKRPQKSDIEMGGQLGEKRAATGGSGIKSGANKNGAKSIDFTDDDDIAAATECSPMRRKFSATVPYETAINGHDDTTNEGGSTSVSLLDKNARLYRVSHPKTACVCMLRSDSYLTNMIVKTG